MTARSWQSALATPEGDGAPVLLHVYDLSEDWRVQNLNKVLAHKWSPMKLGGLFHAGVEVNGLEWSFGMHGADAGSATGVHCVPPRSHPAHHFRQTVSLGRSCLADESINCVLSDLVEEYTVDKYDVLRLNCCDFAEDMCERLGVEFPTWVHRLAHIGAGLDDIIRIPHSTRVGGA